MHVWSPLPSSGEGFRSGLTGACNVQAPHLGPLPFLQGARRERSVPCVASPFKEHTREMTPVVFLRAKGFIPCWRSGARRGEPLHCGKRLTDNEDPVRNSAAPRSLLNRLAALSRVEFLQLLAIFEPGIVILPPGPRAAPSSRESN